MKLIEHEISNRFLGTKNFAHSTILIAVFGSDQGVWWYRSIKFSSDQVLLDTTRLYYYFINKTPNMILKRESPDPCVFRAGWGPRLRFVCTALGSETVTQQ